MNRGGERGAGGGGRPRALLRERPALRPRARKTRTEEPEKIQDLDGASAGARPESPA